MIFPPPQVIFGLLLLSIAVVLIMDIRYNPFGQSEDDLWEWKIIILASSCLSLISINTKTYSINNLLIKSLVSKTLNSFVKVKNVILNTFKFIKNFNNENS